MKYKACQLLRKTDETHNFLLEKFKKGKLPKTRMKKLYIYIYTLKKLDIFIYTTIICHNCLGPGCSNNIS